MRARARSPRRFGLAAGIAVALLVPATAAAETFLLVVCGLGGAPEYRERFQSWGDAMVEAAIERWGVAPDNVWYLTEEPERDPARIRGSSRKEEIVAALEEIRGRIAPGDQLFVLLIGHGSHRSGEAKLNLPGPDLTAEELAALVEPFHRQQLVIVNTASASGEWVRALAGEGRIVVTATKSGSERNETRFGEYFVAAFRDEVADVDKNGRVSVLEAYEYARREVERSYEAGNELQTEHALLDDDGDGEGTHAPDGRGAGDGARARTAYLEPGRAGATADAATTDDPERAALDRELRELEQRVEALRAQKESMPEELYTEELERLLVEIALKRRALEKREENDP